MRLSRLFLIRWDYPSPGWSLPLSIPQDGNGNALDWEYESIHRHCALVPGFASTPRIPITQEQELRLYRQQNDNPLDPAVRRANASEFDAHRRVDEVERRTANANPMGGDADAQQKQAAADNLVRMLFGNEHDAPVPHSTQFVHASVARVFGSIGDTHWALLEQRALLSAMKRDLPTALYHAQLRQVPSDRLLMRELLQPSDDTLKEMAKFSPRLRNASFVIGMHVRTKYNELRDTDALIEPWDVASFVECYANWARSQAAGSLPPELLIDSDAWKRHVLFIATDTPPLRERIHNQLLDKRFLEYRRIVAVPTVASDTHTGPAPLDETERMLLLRTWAEFFLFQYADAAILTAHSSFGTAAADRAGIAVNRRYFINHSDCRRLERGCVEPRTPYICIYHPPHDHDHHDKEVDDHGNPLAALQRIKELEAMHRELDQKLQQEQSKQNDQAEL